MCDFSSSTDPVVGLYSQKNRMKMLLSFGKSRRVYTNRYFDSIPISQTGKSIVQDQTATLIRDFLLAFKATRMDWLRSSITCNRYAG